MRLSTRVQGRSHRFRSVRDVLARAGAPKAGDTSGGVGARSHLERAAATVVLAELTLGDLRAHPVAAGDAVTRAIDAGVHEAVYDEIHTRTVGELRDWMLADTTAPEQIRRTGRALTGEMAAAVAKLCSNLDLMYAARRMPVTTRARTTVGLRGRLATHLQASHPDDDARGIAATVYEGLAYGTGDALIGITPGTSDPDRIRAMLDATHDLLTRLRVPSQCCLAASAAAQAEALRRGAPVDVFFHPLAGTEPALARLGTSIAALDEARAMVQDRGSLHGTQVMYLTICQGTERAGGGDDGVDQTTLAARALALARRYNPFLVESATARLGAAALADSQELIRAGLEDHFIGKLLGVPMGALACGAVDTAIVQDDVESLSTLLATAGVNTLAVAPAGADPVSGRSSSSLHDAVTLRQMLGLRPAPEFETWLVERGLMADGRLTARAGDPAVLVHG